MASDNEQYIVKRLSLADSHKPTGATRHFGGKYGTLLPTPQSLAIVKYTECCGYYLFYLDGDGQEMTDTYHESLEDAMEQAEFEFNVKKSDWEDFTPPEKSGESE